MNYVKATGNVWVSAKCLNSGGSLCKPQGIGYKVTDYLYYIMLVFFIIYEDSFFKDSI